MEKDYKGAVEIAEKAAPYVHPRLRSLPTLTRSRQQSIPKSSAHTSWTPVHPGTHPGTGNLPIEYVKHFNNLPQNITEAASTMSATCAFER
jgi:hypothetical protein